MSTQPGFYEDLVESAQARVAAAPRDKNAALDIVRRSAVALRGLVRHREMPDPEMLVYLAALLGSLERIEHGEDPRSALNLRASGRVRDQKLWSRSLALFIAVGRELDKLNASGESRGDSPTRRAIETVAKRSPRPSVEAAWKNLGATEGWIEIRAVLDEQA